ncbi:hypothetical protein, partial [Pediococcus damnosus]|uniref:hypothetical protein n=1 Tax=Pediococcus damnosus TaxID=51663 RepID=UPI001C12C3C9
FRKSFMLRALAILVVENQTARSMASGGICLIFHVLDIIFGNKKGNREKYFSHFLILFKLLRKSQWRI